MFLADIAALFEFSPTRSGFVGFAAPEESNPIDSHLLPAKITSERSVHSVGTFTKSCGAMYQQFTFPLICQLARAKSLKKGLLPTRYPQA